MKEGKDIIREGKRMHPYINTNGRDKGVSAPFRDNEKKSIGKGKGRV